MTFNWIVWAFDPVKLQMYNPASSSVKSSMVKSPSIGPIHISLAYAWIWICFSVWTYLTTNHATDFRLETWPRNHSKPDSVPPLIMVSLLIPGQLNVIAWPRSPVVFMAELLNV